METNNPSFFERIKIYEYFSLYQSGSSLSHYS